MYIEPTLSEISEDNDFEVYFNTSMQQGEITNEDLIIEIESPYSISYSWEAEYINDTTLSVEISTSGVFEGGEILTVKFVNSKVFRSPIGGCLTEDELESEMVSSLAGSVELVGSFSMFAEFSAYLGIVVAVALVILSGGSLEMIWTMINTMQLISYLVLMTPYFPDHVRVMFQLVKFSNCDFEFLSDTFDRIVSFSSSDSEGQPYNTLFGKNDFESTSFFDN